MVNLLSGTDSIEFATVQHPDMLARYQIYTNQLIVNDTVWHRLRLGFFTDAASATKVVESLKKDYPMARVAKATRKEWAERADAVLVALVASDASTHPRPAEAGKPAKRRKAVQSATSAPSARTVALSTAPDAGRSVVSSPTDTPTECDALTAHPWDPEKLTEGIYWNKVPAGRAVLACRVAVRDNPSARNMYQYARALAKSKDFDEAVDWYRKSATLGYVQAQYSLGDAYEFGEGVQVDYIAAQSWYRKAAARGYTHAADRLTRLKQASNTNTWQQIAGDTPATKSLH